MHWLPRSAVICAILNTYFNSLEEKVLYRALKGSVRDFILGIIFPSLDQFIDLLLFNLV